MLQQRGARGAVLVARTVACLLLLLLVVLAALCDGASADGVTAEITNATGKVPGDPAPGAAHNTTQCDSVDSTPDGQVCHYTERVWPWDCVGYVTLSALVGYFSFFPCLPFILVGLGFDVIGIVAGSFAAVFQSSYGTPCAFRCTQSAAMRGTPLHCRALFGLVGLVLGVVIGAHVLPMCYKEHVSPFNATGLL